ncbi:MAG: hypothetical protein RLZZ601_673 [Pseudomonadota bacterium]|jgi:hypothetical protein
MNASKFLIASICGVLLSACAGPTISTARLSTETYAPTKADKVAVITSGKNIQKPYAEIGLVDAEEGPGTQSYEEIIAAIKVKAAEMGADAVIISTGSKNQGMMPIGGMLMSINGKHVKGVAIRWSNN